MSEKKEAGNQEKLVNMFALAGKRAGERIKVITLEEANRVKNLTKTI